MDILAPVSGTAIPLADVPDPVFAGGMVGPGAAVEPSRSGRSTAVAPAAGTIVKLHPHAYVIATESGQAVLVHLGIDTVQLKGEGFELHAAEGDTVTAGQPIVSWDPAAVEAGGRSPSCPVIALDGSADALSDLRTEGAVSAGDALFTWAV